MLLFEAKQEIDARLSESLKKDYKKHAPEYFDALEIASRSIDRQMRLCEILNDMSQSYDIAEELNVSYSISELYELLNELSIYGKKVDE